MTQANKSKLDKFSWFMFGAACGMTFTLILFAFTIDTDRNSYVSYMYGCTSTRADPDACEALYRASYHQKREGW